MNNLWKPDEKYNYADDKILNFLATESKVHTDKEHYQSGPALALQGPGARQKNWGPSAQNKQVQSLLTNWRSINFNLLNRSFSITCWINNNLCSIKFKHLNCTSWLNSNQGLWVILVK
jgi:hypothetical protein